MSRDIYQVVDQQIIGKPDIVDYDIKVLTIQLLSRKCLGRLVEDEKGNW